MKPQVDTNLFFIAESLYRTLNVSKTAKELGLSQSAVSHALAKLRLHFNDELFVRVSKGMAPTDMAKNLRPSIEAFAQQAFTLSQAHEKFDPKKVNARISIATTDLVEVSLMPSLLKRLKKEAPGLQISLRPTGGELPKSELESGVYDLAIAGFYKNLPEGFYQTKIWEGGFSVGLRKDHALASKQMTSKQFYEADHGLITLQGDFKDSRKPARNFRYGSYSFTGIAWTLAESDLILTAPTILLERFAKYFPIKIQKCPMEMPKIEIRMIWHGLTHKDPLRLWLREVLKSEFAKLN